MKTHTQLLQYDVAVDGPRGAERTDTDIARAALDALRWDSQVPRDQVTLRVEDGFITLEGRTDWFYQRAAAERAVRFLTGVKGVHNVIVVAPKAVVAVVKAKIECALRRSAELDARRIRVEATDDTVTLTGWVRSGAERMDAERAAWAAPGVKAVRDELLISP